MNNDKKNKEEPLAFIPSGMDIVKISILQRFNELDSIFSNYSTYLSIGRRDNNLELTLIETIRDIYYKIYRAYPDINKIKNFEKIEKIMIDSLDGCRYMSYSEIVNVYLFLQNVGKMCGLFKISFRKSSKSEAVNEKTDISDWVD